MESGRRSLPRQAGVHYTAHIESSSYAHGWARRHLRESRPGHGGNGDEDRWTGTTRRGRSSARRDPREQMLGVMVEKAASGQVWVYALALVVGALPGARLGATTSRRLSPATFGKAPGPRVRRGCRSNVVGSRGVLLLSSLEGFLMTCGFSASAVPETSELPWRCPQPSKVHNLH
jgi:hypothetical protein